MNDLKKIERIICQTINKIALLLFFLFVALNLHGNNVSESIKEAIELSNSNPDSAYIITLQLYEKAGRSNNKWQKTVSAEALGDVEYKLEMYREALLHFEEALAGYSGLDSFKYVPGVLEGIGTMHFWLGNYNDATKFFYESIEKAEAQNDYESIARCYQNMGLLYSGIADNVRALKFYNKALMFFEKDKKHQSNVAGILQNIGIVYSQQLKFDTAIDYYKRSLTIFGDLGEINNMAVIYNNLGVLYERLEEPDSTITYYTKALDVFYDIDFKRGVSISLMNIAMVQSRQEEYQEALVKLNESLAVAEEIGFKEQVQELYYYISYIYELMEQWEESLDYFALAYDWRDSLYTTEMAKQITELETKYETQKKEQQILLKDAELESQKIRIVALSLVVALVFVGILWVYTMLINKRKLNDRLEEKNGQLSFRNKQITDSIAYASLIQEALLSPKEILGQGFDAYFLIYAPKDIVSGDFYWATQKDDSIIVALADCTGHGVPGAFMSMLGITMLNEIVNINDIRIPNLILDILRNKIIKSLRQGEAGSENRDGMDIAVCNINQKTNQLSYSGSRMPLYIVRNGEIIKLEADRMPIGYHKRRNGEFALQQFQLEPNDRVYMYSDGIIDQFNPDRKKFTHGRLHNILQAQSSIPLAKQKQVILTHFQDWKQELGQIDDVSMIGLQIMAND